MLRSAKTYDRKHILITGSLILLLIYLCVLIPILIRNNKIKKVNRLNIKDKILLICNPKHFMKPYDAQKIEISNNICKKVMELPEDSDELMEIRREAEEKLNVNFIDLELRKEMLVLTNPKKYMKPYIAENVSIANDLYTRLQNPTLKIDEFEDIVTQAKAYFIKNK